MKHNLVPPVSLDREKFCRPSSRRIIIPGVVGLLLSLLSAASSGADTGTTPSPGFRPGAEAAKDEAFVNSLARSAVIVLPVAIRTVAGLKHDPELAAQLAKFVRMEQLAAQVDVGDAILNLPDRNPRAPQFDVFQTELSALEKSVAGLAFDAEYVLMLELFVVPLGGGAEFVPGIHCFVLSSDGQDTFSFLLNAHHQLMVNAELRTEATSEEARAELVTRAVRVAGEALNEQIATVARH